MEEGGETALAQVGASGDSGGREVEIQSVEELEDQTKDFTNKRISRRASEYMAL